MNADTGTMFKTPGDEAIGALFDAVTLNDRVRVLQLVADGVDVNASDPRPNCDGATALAVAAEEGKVDILRLLLDLGADVNARSFLGWTALMRACNAGQTATAGCLLDAGADPHIRNYEGYTAYGRLPGDCADLLQLFQDRGAA